MAIGLGISYAILQNPDNKIWFSFISIPFSACVVSGYQSWRYNNIVLQKENEFMISNRQTTNQDLFSQSLMALGLQSNFQLRSLGTQNQSPDEQVTERLDEQNQSLGEQGIGGLGKQNQRITEVSTAIQGFAKLTPGLATKMEPNQRITEVSTAIQCSAKLTPGLATKMEPEVNFSVR